MTNLVATFCLATVLHGTPYCVQVADMPVAQFSSMQLCVDSADEALARWRREFGIQPGDRIETTRCKNTEQITGER